MKQLLSVIAKIHEKGNKFIVDQLNQNGISGLVPSHGDILAMLYKYDKLTMKQLAEKIHRTKPTVTVLVKKLERLGFIKREKSYNDNRITYLVLTDKSIEIKPIFERISKELNQMLYKDFSAEEAKLLDNLIKKML